MTDAEIAELAAAWEVGNDETVARIGRAAGVALTAPGLAKIAAMGSLFSREHVLATIGAALGEPSGIAIREVHELRHTAILLVATGAGALVVALGRTENAGDNVTTIWPQIRPWYRDLGRNRARIDEWLARPDRDGYRARGRVSFELVPLEATAAAGDLLPGLVATIVANPDDDAPRLVLADLLQQRGDPHGELIALQVRAATLAHGTAERSALEDRATAILVAHGDAIFPDAARCTTEYRVVRGFVARVKTTASSFSGNGDRLCAGQPIRELELSPVTNESVARLAGVPALARIRRLSLDARNAKGPLRLAPLGKSPYLAALESLALASCAAKDWGATFDALRAPALTSVSVHGGRVELAGLARLVRNPHIALARLHLSAYAHGPPTFPATPAATAELFAALSQRASLRQLELKMCDFVDASAIAVLFAGPGGRALETLDLTGERTGDAALEAIAASGPCALRELDVSMSSVSGRGLLALLRSPAGRRLERVRAVSCRIAMHELGAELARLPASHPLRSIRVDAELPPRFRS